MKTAIINIGDELLIGQVVNSNAAVMSRQLTAAGITVGETATIGDDGEQIASTLRRMLDSHDAVIITGGLGPTKDDITKTVLCRFFDSELVEDPSVIANIERIFASRGYPMSDTNRHQAWVPRHCLVLQNLMGTAPGMWFETTDGKVAVSLPGVPFEMEWLMANEVVPRLRRHFDSGLIVNKNLIVQGIGESFLSDLIESWELQLPSHIKLAYLPSAGMVKLRLTARGDDADVLHREVDRAVAELYPIAAPYIVGEDCESLHELVAQTMIASGCTLATAESCTGGNLARQLTELPGASTYFRGGVVAYSNDVKMKLLGVQADTLIHHGAVSEPTVCEMAEGARHVLDADYAIATTGIAGPGGGSREKPVGTVWIAIASRHHCTAELLRLGDRRQQNIDRTCNHLFAELIRRVKKENN